MVGIVLASHGDFAEGIKMSGSMVFGDQPDVAACTLMPSMGPDDFKKKLEDAVSGFSNQDEVLFLVDLWGGTPFNQVSGLCKSHDKWAVVTGMNLPMLVEAYTSRMSAETAAEVASHIYTEGRNGVRCLPESLQPAEATAKAAPAAAAMGAIPEGTVLGDGKIDIVFCRIDTRLLHGQVATTWTKLTCPDRIIVASDAVAHDDLRKSMIEQAAPPGVKAHVVPIAKMAQIFKDPRFGATKAMVLFETPQDLLACMNQGFEVSDVCIGSMAHSVGKVVASNAIALDQADIDCLQEIASKGVKYDIRKVPSDSPLNYDSMIKKAEAELAEAAK